VLKNPHRGKFIVIEGIDNAGTTTQTKLVTAELKRRGIKATALKEPDDSKRNPIGHKIRKILNKELPFPGHTNFQEMYVESREWLEKSQRGPYQKLGFSTVNDRAHPSTFAYGKASGNLDFDTVKGWHDKRSLFVADLAILIDTPVQVCFDRRGSAYADLFDADYLFQEKVREAYLDLFTLRQDCTGIECEILKGTDTPEVITGKIIDLIVGMFPDLPRG
jgi:dTMP kinase